MDSFTRKIQELTRIKLEFEDYIILNLISEPELIENYSAILQASHFTDETNKKIYKTLLSYYKEKSEVLYPLALKEAREKFLDASVSWKIISGVEQKLVELDLFIKFLQKLHNYIVSFNYATNEPVDLMLDFEKFVASGLNILTAKNRQDYIQIIADEFIKNKNEVYKNFVSTNFHDIDTRTGGGLAIGDVILIGGRPRMGKTTLTCQLASHFAKSYRVNYYSLELDKFQIFAKIIAYLTNIAPSRVRLLTQEEILSAIQNLTLRIIDNIFTIDDLERDVFESKPDVVIVDYIQLLQSNKRYDSRDRELSAIIDHCKYIARKYNCVVIANAQLKRRAEESRDLYPRLSDLRESGGLEATADIVLLINRPELLGILADEDGTSTKDKLYVLIAKNRRGPEHNFKLVIKNSFFYQEEETKLEETEFPF